MRTARAGLTFLGLMLVEIGIPVAVGVAVLRYRLYDIDLVINRTLVYGVLTAGLGGIYVAVSLGLGVAIGSGPRPLPTAAATLAVALLFRLLRANIPVCGRQALRPRAATKGCGRSSTSSASSARGARYPRRRLPVLLG